VPAGQTVADSPGVNRGVRFPAVEFVVIALALAAFKTKQAKIIVVIYNVDTKIPFIWNTDGSDWNDNF
jgi:hypothetical protein